MGNLLAQLISKNAMLVKAANEEGNNYQETFRHVHDYIEITATDALERMDFFSCGGTLAF